MQTKKKKSKVPTNAFQCHSKTIEKIYNLTFLCRPSITKWSNNQQLNTLGVCCKNKVRWNGGKEIKKERMREIDWVDELREIAAKVWYWRAGNGD